MKKKTFKVTDFIQGLHNHIVNDPKKNGVREQLFLI